MAIAVKSAASAATKWAARAGAAAQDYAAGVQAAGNSQQTNALAAAPTWAAGVQAAVSNGSYAKGVQKSGNKWQTNAAGKGAARYPTGIAAGKDPYSTGVAPFLQTIANLTLPPRAPKGDPSNIQRVATIAQALRAQKLAG